MRYFIFSDIHANLEAFAAVLADANRRDYDVALSLGDHVGYGANPNECIDTFRRLENSAALRGNHDTAVLDPNERVFFNADAYSAIVHTAKRLTDDSKKFLEELPLLYNASKSFIGVHATPSQPASWGYILDSLEAETAFQAMTCQVAFTGHSHIPCVFIEGQRVQSLQAGDTVPLEAGTKYIINAGSVGQPRDRDPRAPYIIFDDEEMTVHFYRVEYDWNKASTKIIAAGLPTALAQRILVGL
ncbi:MAG: metallophosphoesterase family protein [Candidatus Latescibacterota bacterium]